LVSFLYYIVADANYIVVGNTISRAGSVAAKAIDARDIPGLILKRVATMAHNAAFFCDNFFAGYSVNLPLIVTICFRR